MEKKKNKQNSSWGVHSPDNACWRTVSSFSPAQFPIWKAPNFSIFFPLNLARFGIFSLQNVCTYSLIYLLIFFFFLRNCIAKSSWYHVCFGSIFLKDWLYSVLEGKRLNGYLGNHNLSPTPLPHRHRKVKKIFEY